MKALNWLTGGVVLGVAVFHVVLFFGGTFTGILLISSSILVVILAFAYLMALRRLDKKSVLAQHLKTIGHSIKIFMLLVTVVMLTRVFYEPAETERTIRSAVSLMFYGLIGLLAASVAIRGETRLKLSREAKKQEQQTEDR